MSGLVETAAAVRYVSLWQRDEYKALSRLILDVSEPHPALLRNEKEMVWPPGLSSNFKCYSLTSCHRRSEDLVKNY